MGVVISGHWMIDIPRSSESFAMQIDELSRHERFMQLFLPSQQSLYVYLRTLIPNPTDAEDVLQNAAAVMWQKFDDFRPGTQFTHWAYAICRLQALHYLKERKRKKLVLSDNILMLLADRAPVISDRTSERMAAMEDCVDQLPQEDRSLLKMRFEIGGTNRSVAHTTGRSEMSVSRRLSRIYGILLECIQRGATLNDQGGPQ